MNNKNPPNSSCLLTVKKVTLIVTLTAVVVMVIGSYYVNCRGSRDRSCASRIDKVRNDKFV